jgi:hypothetical protein
MRASGREFRLPPLDGRRDRVSATWTDDQQHRRRNVTWQDQSWSQEKARYQEKERREGRAGNWKSIFKHAASSNNPPHRSAHHRPLPRPCPGASFQSYILAKFRVSTATAVCDNSHLWNPTKIWAVSLSNRHNISQIFISNSLSDFFGDRPDNFSVCIFGPSIFTFSVANANIAAELLIKGLFISNSLKFFVVPSFREAFKLSQNHSKDREVEDDHFFLNLILNRLRDPHPLTRLPVSRGLQLVHSFLPDQRRFCQDPELGHVHPIVTK